MPIRVLILRMIGWTLFGAVLGAACLIAVDVLGGSKRLGAFLGPSVMNVGTMLGLREYWMWRRDRDKPASKADDPLA